MQSSHFLFHSISACHMWWVCQLIPYPISDQWSYAAISIWPPHMAITSSKQSLHFLSSLLLTCLLYLPWSMQYNSRGWLLYKVWLFNQTCASSPRCKWKLLLLLLLLLLLHLFHSYNYWELFTKWKFTVETF